MTEDPRAPEMQGVLETVLYYEDEDATERFYSDVMGMRLTAKLPGRSLFYRAGSSVFLLFDPKVSIEQGGLPTHGAEGPGHVCFLVGPELYERWKEHLGDRGVEILQNVEWPGRRGKDALHSFYFRDPSGNLLEIADGDLWPD
jgi:catechol 2,3-dioxygenase-like lactoylglutathione lyase family enzyme